MADAYLAALRMLARRELSEMQVRQRLGRQGHQAADIDAAIERLRGERAIDDGRVAEAMARTATSVKRRGRLRVRREIEQAGIAAATARRVVDEVFSTIDADGLLEASLAKRLRGRERIENEKEYARLYRFLIGQGFEPDRVTAALRNYKGHTRHDAD